MISHAKAVFTDVDMTEADRDARELYRTMPESGERDFNKRKLYDLTNRNMSKVRLENAIAELMNELDTDKKRRYALSERDVRTLDESQVR